MQIRGFLRHRVDARLLFPLLQTLKSAKVVPNSPNIGLVRSKMKIKIGDGALDATRSLLVLFTGGTFLPGICRGFSVWGNCADIRFPATSYFPYKDTSFRGGFIQRGIFYAANISHWAILRKRSLVFGGLSDFGKYYCGRGWVRIVGMGLISDLEIRVKVALCDGVREGLAKSTCQMPILSYNTAVGMIFVK